MKFSHTHRKELLWLLISQIVSFVTGIISTKLLTSTGEIYYGMYSLLLTVQGFISLTLYGPVEQGYLKYYFEYKRNDEESAYNLLLMRYLLIGAVVVGICLSGIRVLITRYIQIDTGLALLSALFLIGALTNAPLASYANIRRERKFNALMIILERIGYIVAILLLFKMFGNSLKNALLAFIISWMVVIFLRLKHVKLSGISGVNDDVRIMKEANKKISLFAAPFMVWGIAGWFQSYSERWIVTNFLNIGVVGKYSLLLMIANIAITIPYNLISQLVVPIIYEKTSDSNNTALYRQGIVLIRKYFLSIVALIIVATITLSIVGKEIVLLLSNGNYLEYEYLLSVICVGTGLFCLGQVLCTYGMVLNKPQYYLRPKLLSGLLAVITNYIFIGLYGVNGLIISILATNVFYLSGILFANKRLMKSLDKVCVPTIP